MRRALPILDYDSGRSSGPQESHFDGGPTCWPAAIYHLSIWSVICTVTSAAIMLTVLTSYRDGWQVLLSLGFWGPLFLLGGWLWLLATHFLIADRVWNCRRYRVTFLWWCAATFAVMTFVAFLCIVPVLPC
ncbi:MAG: hypothetical protein ACHRHE_05990 [Tepidisphaerales bacterium]